MNQQNKVYFDPGHVKGAPFTRAWLEGDNLMIHNGHWEKDMVDLIDTVRECSEHTTLGKEGIKAEIPTMFLHQWLDEWKKGPCDEWEFETFCGIKLNSSDYSKLRMFSEVPLFDKKWV